MQPLPFTSFSSSCLNQGPNSIKTGLRPRQRKPRLQIAPCLSLFLSFFLDCFLKGIQLCSYNPAHFAPLLILFLYCILTFYYSPVFILEIHVPFLYFSFCELCARGGDVRRALVFLLFLSAAQAPWQMVRWCARGELKTRGGKFKRRGSHRETTQRDNRRHQKVLKVPGPS